MYYRTLAGLVVMAGSFIGGCAAGSPGEHLLIAFLGGCIAALGMSMLLFKQKL